MSKEEQMAEDDGVTLLAIGGLPGTGFEPHV